MMDFVSHINTCRRGFCCGLINQSHVLFLNFKNTLTLTLTFVCVLSPNGPFSPKTKQQYNQEL